MCGWLFVADEEVDRYMLDAMLQSGQEHTPVLVVSTATAEDTAIHHTPVEVADNLELCKLANHPWQVSNIE